MTFLYLQQSTSLTQIKQKKCKRYHKIISFITFIENGNLLILNKLFQQLTRVMIVLPQKQG